MADVIWHTYEPETISRGYWDQGLLEDLFAAKWRVPGFPSFHHREGFGWIRPDKEVGAVVVLPARHNVQHVRQLNRDLAQLEWVLLILTGDEESVFPFGEVVHPRLRMWIMSPKPGLHHDDPYYQYLGSGYPPQAAGFLGEAEDEARERPLDWFFSGQITHERREQCVAELELLSSGDRWIDGTNCRTVRTPGFIQGLEPEEYYRLLASAKVAPCPSGPLSVDSFRAYEALEAGCVPVVDGTAPAGGMRQHWSMVFRGAPPFPVIDEWTEFPEMMENVLQTWPASANRIGSWWELHKRGLACRLRDDMDGLSVPRTEPMVADRVTVLIPTSPKPTHPSTEILDQTIASVRAQPDLSSAEIFLMCDGVRFEQEGRRGDYEEYLTRVIWNCRHRWCNVYPVYFDAHRHQARMTQEVLSRVATSMVLFVEHDTPIEGDVPWGAMCDLVESKMANVIRLHHEAIIPEPHWHLMPDGEDSTLLFGQPFLRTVQWSQRPHLASTEFYREILATYFSPQSNTMIEDTMHGVAQTVGWPDMRIWIYYPEGNCKRSGNLDGRQDDPKYDMVP
jgi:hypothetical protein